MYKQKKKPSDKGDGKMVNRSIYDDIAKRTGGEFMIGVVGPVRTGKSTFIKYSKKILILKKMIRKFQ